MSIIGISIGLQVSNLLGDLRLVMKAPTRSCLYWGNNDLLFADSDSTQCLNAINQLDLHRFDNDNVAGSEESSGIVSI